MNFSVSQTLHKAQKHQKRGELQLAKALYAEVLEQFPKNAKAQRGLAALSKLPLVPVILPNQAEINHLVSLFQAGDFQATGAYAEELSKRFPQAAMVHNIRGMVNTNLNLNRAAIACFDLAIKLNPTYIDAIYNRGIACRQAGDLSAAKLSFTNVIKVAPKHAMAHYNQGHIQLDQQLFEQAEESMRASLNAEPENPAAYNNLGNSIQLQGRVSEAIPMFEKALELDPNYFQALSNLGIAQKDLGQIDRAMKSLRQALSINPTLAETHKNLSDIVKYTAGDKQISDMEILLDRPEVSDSDAMYLHFALGKAQSDIKNIDQAFSHLSMANNLHKAASRYSISEDQKLFSQIKNQFSAASANHPSISNQGSEEAKPVFILGMPRSGTSLVEQILSSHSMIDGLGELDLMRASVKSVDWQNRTFDARLAQEIRDSYLQGISKIGTSAPFFTDKMPSNFMWIGFILGSFPNAKIIHTKRDARATCWSIYKNFFNSTGQGFAYSLRDVAAYYKLYENLMEFWETVFPDRIHHVTYETLTLEQELESRKLIEFIGIPWEEQCLEFYKSKRAVQTTSATQVRKKMYQGSSDAWREYETYLGPLLSGLDDPA